MIINNLLSDIDNLLSDIDNLIKIILYKGDFFIPVAYQPVALAVRTQNIYFSILLIIFINLLFFP